MNEKHLSPKGLFHELHKLMDTFLSNSFMDLFNVNLVEFSVTETENAYIIEAALPGYHPKNINIHISGSYLHIHAFKTILQSVTNEQNQTFITEQSQESIQRKIPLPIAAEHKPITAVYQNQMLKIIVKKDGFISQKMTIIPVQS